VCGWAGEALAAAMVWSVRRGKSTSAPRGGAARILMPYPPSGAGNAELRLGSAPSRPERLSRGAACKRCPSTHSRRPRGHRHRAASSAIRPLASDLTPPCLPADQGAQRPDQLVGHLLMPGSHGMGVGRRTGVLVQWSEGDALVAGLARGFDYGAQTLALEFAFPAVRRRRGPRCASSIYSPKAGTTARAPPTRGRHRPHPRHGLRPRARQPHAARTRHARSRLRQATPRLGGFPTIHSAEPSTGTAAGIWGAFSAPKARLGSLPHRRSPIFDMRGAPHQSPRLSPT